MGPDAAEPRQELAKRHLWMHFAKLGSFVDRPVHMIVRGEGCYVWDDHERRYLDGIAGLFASQLGHGRAELVDAGARQAAQLAYFPLWGQAHPTAVDLAARLAAEAPGDLNRVFFTSGGSEAVESAWKLARQYFHIIGQPQRHKVIARHLSYHGTTLGALAITGLPAYREPFQPVTPGAVHVANTNRFRPAFSHLDPNDEDAFSAACADAVEQAIVMEGPDTVAAVFVEPVQNAGGCIPPPDGYFARLREICDRYGVLLVSDEVICAFGRLGHLFGCDRYRYQPDVITLAKGITSGYAPLGAVVASDRIAEPFLQPGASFAHGLTFGGHPVSCAVALANLDVFAAEDVMGHVRRSEPELHGHLDALRDLPLVGDVRGAGFFWALELVKDPVTNQRFEATEATELAGRLSARIADAGLLCRVIDRGDLVVQLSPPLVAGPEELAHIEAALRVALTDALPTLPR